MLFENSVIFHISSLFSYPRKNGCILVEFALIKRVIYSKQDKRK